MRIYLGTIISLGLAVGCTATDTETTVRPASRVDTIVVNSVRPFALPVASARKRPAATYTSPATWRAESGDSSLLANAHEILCAHRGDVTLASAAERVQQHMLVRCRPVVAARLATPIQLVLGDSAQSLQVAAYDRDSQPVNLLSGTITILDSSIAKLNGSKITPLRAGATAISVQIGDQEARGSVHVYERVSSLDELQRRIRLVVVPLALRQGEMRRWRLPRGTWMLSMWPEDDGGNGPRLRVEGANCVANDQISKRRVTCFSTGSAFVTVQVASDVKSPAPGMLAVRPVNGTQDQVPEKPPR
jgi:hypothetical protein